MLSLEKYSQFSRENILLNNNSDFSKVPRFFPQRLQTAHWTMIRHTYVLPWLPCAIVSDTENVQKLTKTYLRSHFQIVQFHSCQFLVIDALLWEIANYVGAISDNLFTKRIAKWCQKVQRRIELAKWQNGKKYLQGQHWSSYLSSCGISSPRGFTHRKSRTSSKFGTWKCQIFNKQKYWSREK